jgi:hypothetical protein
MSVRFRRDNIIHDDAFFSWIAWIYDLCSSNIFLHCWNCEGLRNNYIEFFQNIIDQGLCYAHGKITVQVVRTREEQEIPDDDQKYQSQPISLQRLHEEIALA